MRTVKETNLGTRAARARLAVRAKPYWRTVVPGLLHVGYRKRGGEVAGTWLARRYLGSGRYMVGGLGLADDFDDRAMSFADAQSAAHSATATPRGGPKTVEGAMEEYIAYLKSHDKGSLRDALSRISRHIVPALGRIRLGDLTTHDINVWLAALAEAPAALRTGEGKPSHFRSPPTSSEEKRKRRNSANRTLAYLTAALNRAFRSGYVEDDRAWRRVQPFAKVNAARPRFLTNEEAGRIINAADADFRSLVYGALLTGARYGELCSLLVRNFSHGKLHVARSKSGRPRDIALTDEAIAFFEALTAGREPDAPLFTRDDGSAWTPSQQTRRMLLTCRHANIRPTANFHALRHTYASLSVMAGMPLLILAKNLGHVDTTMVERFYGHLVDGYIDEQVRLHAPRYNIATEPMNVRTLVRANKRGRKLFS